MSSSPFAAVSKSIDRASKVFTTQLQIIKDLSMIKVCRARNTKNDLNKLSVKDLVNTLFRSPDWYTAEVQEKLACIVTTLLEENGSSVEDLIVGSKRARALFNPLRQVSDSTQSAQGVTAATGFEGSDYFAIIKYPFSRSARYDEDLIHEIAVGLVLNTLREYTPNFMYVYGGFLCTPMVSPAVPVKKKQQMTTPTLQVGVRTPQPENLQQTIQAQQPAKDFVPDNLCAFEDPSSVNAMVLTELVHNSNPNKKPLPLFTYLQQAVIEQEDIDNIFLQLFFSLTFAYRMYNFRHNDLHAYNVLIHELDKSTDKKLVLRLPYLDDSLDLKHIEIKTWVVPQIIDYGYSTITYNGETIRGDMNQGYDMPLKRDAVRLIWSGLFTLTNKPSSKSIRSFLSLRLRSVIDQLMSLYPYETDVPEDMYVIDEVVDHLYELYINDAADELDALTISS